MIRNVNLGLVRTELFLLWYIVSIASCEVVFKHNYHSEVKKYGRQETQITKVSFTQKGYIQFLRYTVDVPTVEEFTYCIWVKSSNFTHSHPLLSYSKNERERLIRGWIGPFGETINLEILEREIYSFPLKFVENQWYHICQSWDSHVGAWMLFVDGKLRESGINAELRNIPIPEAGDVVVGQEYTDFDKGLDDGIEGDIFGFNLLLISTLNSLDKQAPQDYQLNELLPQRRQIHLPSHRISPLEPLNMQRRNSYIDYYPSEVLSPPARPRQEDDDIPEVLGYFNFNRQPKGFFDFGKGVFNMFFGKEVKKPLKYIYPKNFYVGKRITNDARILYQSSAKSLGLVLVEESYNNCAKGKGSPIEDSKLLISWTKTPVRVFGGALLKLVPPFCIRIT